MQSLVNATSLYDLTGNGCWMANDAYQAQTDLAARVLIRLGRLIRELKSQMGTNGLVKGYLNAVKAWSNFKLCNFSENRSLL